MSDGNMCAICVITKLHLLVKIIAVDTFIFTGDQGPPGPLVSKKALECSFVIFTC